MPLCVCQLTHADFVDLSANKIVTIPDGIQVISAVEINLNQNQINHIPETISACKRLKVLRLEENCLHESGIPPVVLADSTISLLCLQGNPLDINELRSMPEYEKVCLLVNSYHLLLFECVPFCCLVLQNLFVNPCSTWRGLRHLERRQTDLLANMTLISTKSKFLLLNYALPCLV